MSEQWRGVAGSKWFLFAVVGVVMFLSVAVRTYGIKDPWVQGHLGWSGYRSGNIARNFVRFGYADTRMGAVRDVGPVRPEKFTYDEHPPLIYWLTSLSFHFFGIAEWSATLVPIVCSAGSIALLFMLAFRWWGLSVALLSAAFMVLVPMDAYYGRMVDHEAPTLLFSLLAFYLYTLWKEKRSRSYLIGVFGALILAMLSGFPGYFVAPWLALYHIFSERYSKSRWTIAILLLLSGPLFFLISAVYLRWLSGSFAILANRFAIRIAGGWGPWVFTLPELYRLEFERIRGLYTSTLMLLSVIWIAFMAWDVWHKRNWERHGFVAMLGGFGITYVVLFQQSAYQHDFMVYYLTPFFCIASGWALVLLIERFLYGRWHILAALALIVFVAFFGEATAMLRSLYWPRQADHVEVAQYLNGKLPDDGKVISIVEDNIRNQWRFYIDRPSRDDVTDLAQFEWVITDPAYRYFVLDSRLSSSTTLELRTHLFEHYSAEVRGPFLIFDLHNESPNLIIADGAVRSFHPLSGEQFQHRNLTLLGYEMPAEVSWNRPSGWNKYLYSAETYWPEQPDIAVQVTVYWRREEAVPSGYRPAVTLRAEHGRLYQIEPIFAPEMAAYPPEYWEPGATVRTDYFFSIPESYPAVRYTLSINWSTGTEPDRLRDDDGWIPVAELSVLPVSLPKPLREIPRPRYHMASTPVAGLKFLGYDLDREKVKPGETLRLKTYWQATAGLNDDYAFLAQLEKGKYELTEPLGTGPTRLWESGQAYRVESNWTLPAEILAGNYPLTLKIRGRDEKASIPLTTLEVVTDQQVGLVQRWGYANGVGDAGELSPGEPRLLNFTLREPHALTVLATWTGRSELDQTCVEVYMVNGSWYAPRKYLTTWVVGQGMLRTAWVHVPESLTARGQNTIELRVPPVSGEVHSLGWRGTLDAFIPGILHDVGENEAGALEIDFVQVVALDAGDSWEAFYDLAAVYTEREMWDEVKQVYRKAHEKGILPTDPQDLQLFFEAEQASPDANLKSQLESRLMNLIPNQTHVVLGERIAFLGYELKRVSPEGVHITLFFRGLKPLAKDYTVWVHAVPHDPGNLFGTAREQGYFALDRALPTSSWNAGVIWRESYDVILPPDSYDFSLGIWHWQDGSRLWRQDHPDAHVIELGWIDLNS